MKKILLVFVLLYSTLSLAHAQLKIKSTGSESERFYKDTWATITWNGSSFMFNSSDPVTGLTLSFTLGVNKSAALTTLNQMCDFLDNSGNKASITFEDNGREITLYKIDAYEIGISNGDAEFIRKETSRRISGAILGTPQYAKKESTPHYSFIKKKALVESIEALSALSDPKYIGEDYENDPAYQAAQSKEQKKKLCEQALVDYTRQISDLKEKIKDAKDSRNNECEKELKKQLRELQKQYDTIYNYLNSSLLPE